MSNRFCHTCRFYKPNVGMRGEPYCDRLKKWVGTTVCCSEWQPKKPQTNADRIRAMSDEELAGFLTEIRNALTCVLGADDRCSRPDDPCVDCWIDWLKQEVSDV